METQNETASWIIVDRRTNRAIAETFHAHVAAAVNRDHYDAVPVLEYLVALNARIKAEAANGNGLVNA